MSDKPMSPWRVTLDPATLRRIGKTAEELAELLVIVVWLLWQDFEGLYAKWQERKQDGSRS